MAIRYPEARAEKRREVPRAGWSPEGAPSARGKRRTAMTLQRRYVCVIRGKRVGGAFAPRLLCRACLGAEQSGIGDAEDVIAVAAQGCAEANEVAPFQGCD